MTGLFPRTGAKPPIDVFDDRVPVTEANKIDVLDPISALVMPTPRPAGDYCGL